MIFLSDRVSLWHLLFIFLISICLDKFLSALLGTKGGFVMRNRNGDYFSFKLVNAG